MRRKFAQWVRYAMISLLVLCSTACGQDRDEIAYDMVAQITTGSAIKHVAVRFVDIPFYWEWGGLAEGGWKSHSDTEPRRVPKALLLSWEKDGKKFERSFAIEMPRPEMLERIRNSGVNVNGHTFKSNLELRFEISPDENTARVYWHESKFPPLSRPKDDSTGSTSEPRYDRASAGGERRSPRVWGQLPWT